MNIITGIKSEVLNEIIKSHYKNATFYSVADIKELFHYHRLKDAIIIVETALFMEEGLNLLKYLIEEDFFNTNLLLISYEERKKMLYSLIFPKIFVSTVDEFEKQLERLQPASIDLPPFDEIKHLINSRDNIDKQLTKEFILKYSNNFLDNMIDLNNYFLEFVNMIKIAFGIKRIILNFIMDDKTNLFTTVSNFEIVIQPNDKETVFLSENPQEITDDDNFITIPFSLSGKKIAELYLFSDNEYFTNLICSTLNELSDVIKKFYLFTKTNFLQEALLHSCADTTKLNLLIKEFIKKDCVKNFKVFTEKSNYHCFPFKNGFLYFTTTTSEYHHNILTLYLYNLSKEISDFKTVCSKLNGFIHSNLIHFYPLPLAITFIEDNTITYCATSDLIIYNITDKEIVNCDNPYFGMYKNIDLFVKKVYMKDNSIYIQLPEYHLIPPHSREEYLRKVVNELDIY